MEETEINSYGLCVDRLHFKVTLSPKIQGKHLAKGGKYFLVFSFFLIL